MLMKCLARYPATLRLASYPVVLHNLVSLYIVGRTGEDMHQVEKLTLATIPWKDTLHRQTFATSRTEDQHTEGLGSVMINVYLTIVVVIVVF